MTTTTHDRGHSRASTRLGRRLLISVVVLAGTLTLGATPALAGHDHFVVTPSGCHRVAFGQSAIGDTSHGGFHRFHENVHVAATESSTSPSNLGDGHAVTAIYKDACPS